MCKHLSKFKQTQIIIMVFVLFGLTQSMLAQRQDITGTVKSESGEVLPGVTILTKESKSTGTATDFDGNFSLKVPEKVNTLIFSYVGFKSQEVLIAGRSVVNVNLVAEENELDEVVVVGYGTQKRRDVTGAIASIKAAELERTVNANLGDALQGRVAGVQVLSEDGTPGGGFKINIRGASSISGSTQPLYVVDGFPIEVFEGDPDLDTGYEGGGSSDPLDFLDPALIESIEILKDASATAIYGARGANGVVIVTTKQGKAGATRINYTVSGSVSAVRDAGVQNMLSTSEYFDYHTARGFYGPDNRSWDATNEEWVYSNPDISTFRLENPYPEDPDVPEFLTRDEWNNELTDTDWPREILRTGLLVNHVLSVSGGGEKNQYNYTGSYLKNEGVAKGSGYDRFVLNVNLKNKFSERLSAQTTLSPTISSQYGTGGGGSSVRNSWGPFTRAMNTAPYARVGASYYTEDDYDDIADNPIYQDPVYQLENEINNNKKYGFRGMTKWTYKITDNLKAVVDVGVRYDHQEQRQYNPPGFGIGKKGAGGRARRVDKNGWSWNNSNLLNYNKKFGKHRLDLTAVYTQQSKRSENYTQQATGFDESIEDGSTDFDLATEYNTPKIRIQEIKQTGLLGRVNYTYDNRYSLTASLRRDGDSRFAKNPDNIYRNFPAFGFAWNISNENFMDNADFIDNLKLRMSYGKSGNSGTRPKDSREAFVPLNYSFGDYTGSGTILNSGYGNRIVVDDKLTWQETYQGDIGMDISFFKNRINLVADVYMKNTEGMILDQPLQPNTGYSYIRTNAGDLDNWGLEFQLITDNIRTENFTWTTNISWAADRSEVKSLNGPTSQVFKDRLTGGNSIVLQVGENIGTWLGYEMDGVYNSWEEIEASPITQTIRGDLLQPGDPKYVDFSGDGRINTDDLTIIAQTQPKFHGGIWNNFVIKNFEFGFFLTYKYGFDMINGDKLKFNYHSRGGGNMSMTNIIDQPWTPDNPDSEYPGYHVDAGSSPLPLSSYHIEDGSFVRLQNINLTYNIPHYVLKDSFLNSVQLQFNVSNVHLWTKYTGSDPENSVNRGQYANLGPNLDWGSYPRPRNFNITAKIGF